MRNSAFVRTISAFAVAFCITFIAGHPRDSLEAAAQADASISPSSDPISWQGFFAAAAAAPDEADCLEGFTCDTFLLNVEGTPADWAGKTIPVAIQWSLSTNDFDLYIHKESNSTPVVSYSAGPPPSTTESTAIDPSTSGTGLYSIHIVYFAVAGDQYAGSASVAAAAPRRSANYQQGGIPFSANVAVKAPAARRDGEPSNRTDKFGNHYVAGIRGVPAGTDLWYFDLQPNSPGYDPHMRNPIYRGQPDGFVVDENNAASVGADGGGDIDLAVGFGPTNPSPLAAVSLVAANISATRSTDRAGHYTLNPVGSTVPVDDRQWIEAYRDGNVDAVYLYYRTISVPVNHFIQRSDDGGLTYGPPVFVGFDGQTGYVDVDQRDGTVYASRQTSSAVTVAVGIPPGPGLAPLSYTDHVAAVDATGPNNIFAPVKVADDGTVYVSYSNGRSVFLVHSTDKGQTWSLPVRVSDGPDTQTSLFPWIETGALPGSVAVVWYGSASANTDEADWHVFFAQTLNATADVPTFTQVVASDHVIHGSNISTGGLLGAANRNLLDYFQVSIDPVGAAVIAYTDDHNDFDGHTYVTRQIGGPSFNGGAVPSPGRAPAPTRPPADGSQVVDFAQDHVAGLLLVSPLNSPFDITSIKYSCEDSAAGRLLVARMAVSHLPAVAPLANWRMNFTANAPHSIMSPTGEYTFGLSDRGDQFFMRASTDTNPAGSFTFGTAVRNSNGSLSYTTRGAADFGALNAEDKSITVKVLLSKLDPFVSKGPVLGVGSVLVGLRGQTFTTGANAATDIARGGTQYALPANCSSTVSPPPPPPPPPPGKAFRATGAGGLSGQAVGFAFNADNTPSGHLNYRDEEQDIHLVSAKILSFVQIGPNEVAFSGTGTVRDVPVTFEVTVSDNGEPGKDDVFRIEISGGRTSSRSGTLSRGNIQVHR